MVRRPIVGFGLSTAFLSAWMATCSPSRTAPLGPGGLQNAGAPEGDGSVLTFPTLDGWQFYGPQQGGPASVFGVTSDLAGNIWVAGGEEGLFLLKPGSSMYQRYTMADGLRPYGYMPDGSDPPGDKYLKVISVSGGPANTVFVGYQGKPPAAGQLNCEYSWYGPDFPPPLQQPRDPSIYKSGDADRVMLQADDRISVVHYDIFTGPGIIADEMDGREKICDILRIVYDPITQSVWFGGNHGFAWGDANYPGDPTCNGQLQCSGVREHSHPAINAYGDESRSSVILLTGDYYGVSVDSVGDVWFGGAARSTKFGYATYGRDFFTAGYHVEAAQFVDNRLDIWPDCKYRDGGVVDYCVSEPAYPIPSERVDDWVSDMAAMPGPDGGVWISSFNFYDPPRTTGLAHYVPGRPTEYFQDPLTVNPRGNVAGLERDPQDDSLWIGYMYGGLARLRGGQYVPLDYQVLGWDLTQGTVPDIQSDNFGGQRRILVGFHGGAGRPGAIGIYTGN